MKIHVVIKLLVFQQLHSCHSDDATQVTHNTSNSFQKFHALAIILE